MSDELRAAGDALADEIDRLRARVAELEAAEPRPLPATIRGCANAVVDAWADWSGDPDDVERLSEAINILHLELAAGSVSPDDAHTRVTTKSWHEIRLRFTDNRGKTWDKRVRSDQDCGNDPERWRRRVAHGAALARDLRETDPDAYLATRTVSTTTRTSAWKAEQA